jgi:hypothetical protein
VRTAPEGAIKDRRGCRFFPIPLPDPFGFTQGRLWERVARATRVPGEGAPLPIFSVRQPERRLPRFDFAQGRLLPRIDAQRFS